MFVNRSKYIKPFSAVLFILLCLFVFTPSSNAAQVTLAWDANYSTPDGYRIFQRSGGGVYSYDTPVWSGIGTTCTLDALTDGTTYYFVVRAFSGGDESGDSNEVSHQAVEPVPTTYTIAASAGANGTISPAGSLTVSAGESSTYAISANTGCHVAGVLVDGNSVGAETNYTFSNVSANHTINAAFAINSYSIASSAGTGGTISPSGTGSVTYGGSRSYTIAAGTGYQVANVLVDGVSVGAVTNYTFSNVSASHTISASFAVRSYTISATAGTGGTISPSGTGSVTYGGSRSYAIAAGTGYQVANVLVDGVSVGAVTSYTFSHVNASHTISVSFAARSYTITASAGANGTISPSGTGSVNYGSSRSYTIAANAGYCVADVLVDNVSVGALSSFTFNSVVGNHSIQALFNSIASDLVPQSRMTVVSVDSEELNGEDGSADNAIDGRTDTFWHTEWYQANPNPPHEIVIDLGGQYNVEGFRYLPRQDGEFNGTVARYAFYVSQDGTTWAASVATGAFSNNLIEKEVRFQGEVGRYVRFEALSEINANAWTCAAEINVIGNPVAITQPILIPQSRMTVVSVDSEELDGEDGSADNAIDGRTDTFWHTEWYQANPNPPHEIVIDLGGQYNVQGFRYLPRQDGEFNGTVARYAFYVSQDGTTWAASVASGAFSNGLTEKEVRFQGKAGRYVRFEALSEINANAWTCAAEINVLGY